MKPIRQPKTLTLDGIRYRLVLPWRHIGGSISEGPFYSKVGDTSGDLYLPDAGFLHTKDGTLQFLHRLPA